MCGLAGWHRSRNLPDVGLSADVMAGALVHRGPDAGDSWQSHDGTTSLGFRRLAIRDLDMRANQPMTSAGGNTTIVFNGEIYNTRQLVARYLNGVTLRTTGDTEVLLELFERRGPEILSEINGMFAVAIWSRDSGTVHLARDGAGKKPLYLYHGDGFTGFASELRAFTGWPRDPDPDVVPHFLHFGYVPAPRTFFRQIDQLRPGEVVQLRGGRVVSRRRFHDPLDWEWGRTTTCDEDRLAGLLDDAVACRTQSDVPLGTFLSGGVDSSLVVAALADGGHRDLPVFTVSFDESRYDEAPHAAAIAAHLGLSHQVISVDLDRLPELVDDYLDCYEQPYADTSGLPTMLLCQAVRQHVTVALCGDGGDEFFGGYTRYDWFQRALSANRWPRAMRWLAGQAAVAFNSRKGQRLASWLENHDPPGLYAEILRGWHVTSISQVVPDIDGADERPVSLVRDVFDRVDADPVSSAAAFDAAFYIPDDLQVKVDRASMRFGLEVRCPLLDHRVRRFGAELSTDLRTRRGLKTVLRDQLARRVPRALFERPKMGFGVPLAGWLAGPLADRIADSLGAQVFRECGWLDRETVESVMRSFRSGRSEYAGAIWKLFVLSEVLQKQATTTTAASRVVSVGNAA